MRDNLIILAAQFARLAHLTQKREDGTPYIYHPMRVAGNVSMHIGATETMVTAAWLHDVVEDCGVQPITLEKKFGLVVSDMVMELTNPSQILKLKEQGVSRKQRKKIDLEHIMKISRDAQIIKMYDRIDNLLDKPKHSDGEWRKKYAQESMDLYDVVKDADETLANTLLKAIQRISQ